MTTNPWPPEGTRVRITTNSRVYIGELIAPCKHQLGHYWVRMDGGFWQAFQRHEIEVIDAD
jgi:hypothetical protein